MRNGQFTELDLEAPLPPRRGPYMISDIGEYRSVITREMITSRSQHREHLRAHGCVEVGNEMPHSAPQPLPPVGPAIQAALQASPETHAEARVASERASRCFGERDEEVRRSCAIIHEVFGERQ
jgi:hypothetical protein